MSNKIVDDIVWYIPFKRLRNAVRNYLNMKIEKEQEFINILYKIYDISIENNNIVKNIQSSTSANEFFNDSVKDIYKTQLLEMIENKYNDSKRLEKFGFKVYSQNDEDGIINEIFNRIGTTNKFFVEFGVQNGLESNCHYLLFQGWEGVWIEGDKNYFDMIQNNFKIPIENDKLTVLNKFIDIDNINDILCSTKANKIKDIDLLSIDIDGNDYHVFKAINVINPRVVVIEYNAKFPPPVKWIMPYNPTHVWDFSDNQGSSLESLTYLANEKGYQLVGTNATGLNAFFVRNDLCFDKFPKDASASNLYNNKKNSILYQRSGHPSMYFLPNSKDQ